MRRNRDGRAGGAGLAGEVEGILVQGGRAENGTFSLTEHMTNNMPLESCF